MLDEFAECEEGCRKDPGVIAALARRGLTDLDLVCFEPWSVGYFGEDAEGRRLMRALVFVRDEPEDSPYAHPIENFIVFYDLNSGEVVKVEDDEAIPVPAARGNYLPKYVGPARTDLKPIEITQPEGASFQVTGNHVQWADWSFRVGFTPREGLVLHQLKFRDQGVERPVINRASLSEMVVPYGDTAPVQAKKNAFDSGEYNIGNMANSLTLGCDCLGEIKYFDGNSVDSHGNPWTIENAICMHEEDDSILWKHFDFREGTAETRRNRKLVISFIATVANYEYAFYWHLYLDGSIEFLVKATGILSTAGQKPGQKSPYGQSLNNDGLYAPIHQHMFNVRMDFEIDGVNNAVYEVDMEYPEHNPTHTAFKAVDRLLETEQAAIRKTDSAKHRFWKIANRESRNIVDEPVAYRLIPTDGIQLAAGEDSYVSQRAQFARNNLWVTAYDRTERFAAGEYPNQSTGAEDGLHIWTQARPEHRRSGPRGLVHLRHAPRRPPRRLARDAPPEHRLHARTPRLLQPKPHPEPPHRNQGNHHRTLQHRKRALNQPGPPTKHHQPVPDAAHGRSIGDLPFSLPKNFSLTNPKTRSGSYPPQPSRA